MGGRLSVHLVQQGVWDLPLESMPLASGYLKATAMADERLTDRLDITIHNFGGGDRVMTMAERIFGDGVPDVLAFSVLGWNFRRFGALAETFRQLNPDGLVVFGGTHVSNQAQRVMRLFPEVDVVVNGEGELTFADLLAARLAGAPRDRLGLVSGLSYRGQDGQVLTTLPRDRMEDLDQIPSPFLTGAIDLTNDRGEFRFDVALMETNRGCPYKCSFCYWGGAVGQRIHAFSRQRLRAELEVFAQHRVHTIVLCDANFGILPIDAEFVADLVEVRQKFGYPRALEASWAKNKSAVFFDIVRTIKQHGLKSSFTLALQSLSDEALRGMNRRNMKLNAWEDLAAWLDREGLDCYAELIWGAPGETVESFMKGYDQLSRHVSRIAVYPMHLLPNTEYAEKKQEYGIVSVRGEDDDFEYVLSHDTMSQADNRLVKRFLFWSRVVAENAVLRHSWVGLRELTDVTQSTVLRSLDEWIAATDDPAAEPLRAAVARGQNSDVAYGDAVRYIFGTPDATALLRRWWDEAVLPLVPPHRTELLREIFRYDLLTLPAYRLPDAGPAEELPVVEVGGAEYFQRKGVALRADVPAVITALRAGADPGAAEPVVVDLYYRVGAEVFIGSTNHEQIIYFMGITEAEMSH